MEKVTIGRIDRIDFPEFGLFELDAKIDTGANYSVIHCHHVQKIEQDGKELLQFTLLDPSHPNYNEHVFFAHQYGLKTIKNSFGQTEERFVITTPIILFGKSIETEFTFTDRGNLKYPVLLGRKLLKKRFIVDVGRTNLSYKQKQKEN